MKYSDFRLYTVAKGQRFIDAAFRCARSFVDKNPGLKFTIFEFWHDVPTTPSYEKDGIQYQHVILPKYFTPAMLKKKPCADILFFKYADAPFMLEGNEKYIGQVDADSLCMCKLPFEYFINDLSRGLFCAASDPKVEVNKKEIEKYYGIEWKLYFNSGICFWKREMNTHYFSEYKDYTLLDIDQLSNMKYADQTWINIYMNTYRKEYLSEIGYYWNMRGTVRHPRAYIWHAGGRDSEGIEVLKEEFESWK